MSEEKNKEPGVSVQVSVSVSRPELKLTHFIRLLVVRCVDGCLWWDGRSLRFRRPGGWP